MIRKRIHRLGPSNSITPFPPVKPISLRSPRQTTHSNFLSPGTPARVRWCPRATESADATQAVVQTWEEGPDSDMDNGRKRYPLWEATKSLSKGFGLISGFFGMV